jgi:flagellar biosynthesis regulator FlaF
VPPPNEARHWFCSAEHQEIGLIDKTKHEEAALKAASQAGGEYADSLHSTDMARWTAQQWATFIETICTEFTKTLGELASKEAPF